MVSYSRRFLQAHTFMSLFPFSSCSLKLQARLDGATRHPVQAVTSPPWWWERGREGEGAAAVVRAQAIGGGSPTEMEGGSKEGESTCPRCRFRQHSWHVFNLLLSLFLVEKRFQLHRGP